MPTSAGVGTVTFYVDWGLTSDPSPCTYYQNQTATSAATFTAYAVAALDLAVGTASGNTYTLCQSAGGTVQVSAMSNPGVSSAGQLPSGWTMTVDGASQGAALTATLSTATVGTHTVTCTAGSSTMTVTLQVVAASTLDSDYDGVCDCQERIDGTDPNSASSVAQVPLGQFPLSTGAFAGARGQTPLVLSGVSPVPGWKGNGIEINTVSQQLVYRHSESATGTPNFNAKSGTVRFWYSPNWSSSSIGGTGPTVEARLFELKDYSGTPVDEWWALNIDANGNTIRFQTHTPGTTTTILATTVPLAWRLKDWHQLALTYSASSAALYIDGVSVATSATGVAYTPSAQVRANGGLSIGNDPAMGRLDEVETLNFTISPTDVQQGFVAEVGVPKVNTCLLRPIGVPATPPGGGSWVVSSTYTLNVGTVAGNFSWLHWDGRTRRATPDELAQGLGGTLDSRTAYYNPLQESDRDITIGDPIRGDSGVSLSIGVRSALDALISAGTYITVPLYSSVEQIQSDRFYWVSGYAQIQLTAYDFSNPKTLTFIYRGSSICDATQAHNPVAVADSYNVNEDAVLNITAPGVLTNDTDQDSDPLTASLYLNPTHGSLTLNANGSFTYTPAASYFGTDSFSYRAFDGALYSAPVVVNITINSINDCPTLDVISALTVNEDAATQTVNLTGIGPGPNESQTLTVSASSSNPGLIPNPTVTYTSPNPTGSLTFTPVANQSGTATITVTVQDNGGTALGGCNSLVRTFLVTVNAINDCPTLNTLTALTINEDAGGQTVNLSGIGPGPNETGQALTITASSSNTGLVPAPTVTYTSPNATGTLSFAPLANQSGSATITVTVQDNGGTANGGCNNVVRTFLVTVNPVNDCPTLNTIAPLTLNEDATTQTINLSGIGPGPSETGQALTLTVSSSNTGLIPTPTITYTSPNSTATLTCTPVANQLGTATITVTVQDNGGTANGGCNSLVRTFVVTVNPVNDPPIVNAGPDITIVWPSPGIIQLQGTATDPDNPAASLTITWSKLIGPGIVTFLDPATFNPGAEHILNPYVKFSDPGVYQLRLTASDAQFSVSDVATVTVLENKPPVVDAGPDRRIAPGGTAALSGNVKDDGVDGPLQLIVWIQVSGPATVEPVNRWNPATSATFTQPGIYVFQLYGADSTFSVSDTMTVMVSDPNAFTYTFNADFAKGLLQNVNFDEVPDQLQLNKTIKPFPFVYVPCSERGTVVRIDANSGQIVGEYATAPTAATTSCQGTAWPSRTAVDSKGNLWIANSGDIWNDNGIRKGSITRIGVVIGGTRGRKVSGNFIPDPNGEYLQPPFIYNTCKDRDGDGLIKTSMGRKTDGTSDVRPWNNLGGVDTPGGVATAEDEAVLNYIRVRPTASE
jgi:VCBS repeat-containing protein